MSTDDIEPETPTIEDLTRLDIEAAGIDTDRIRRGDTRLGENWYEYIDGDLRVVFGPGEDTSDGTTLGWDICTYERFNDGWDPIRQNWKPTRDLMLRYVKEETRDIRHE